MSDVIGSIYSQFDMRGVPVETGSIKSGHINDTYLLKTDQGTSYVLQRINSHVFGDPEAVIRNKVLVADHIREKPGVERNRSIRFVNTKQGDFFVRDASGDAWNLMDYIGDSHVFLKTPNSKVAYEAGRIFGDFLQKTADLDPGSLVETMPRFHSMSLRYEQFREVLERAKPERIEAAGNFVELVNESENEMTELESLAESGVLPLRVTHNDTKISNALFSKDDEAICVIDLDTVMPGIVHYDFGDAVRTICSGADEDEQELENVRFNSEYFEQFVKGFLKSAGSVLNEKEVEGLALSAKIMTFIIGLRFLTDYLNNDVYFETDYDDHNLVRARNQFRLAGLISERLPELNSVVLAEFQKASGRI